jgi:hypothetical protein
MAVIMNLAALPVKFVAIPILAGLAAGTGAVAAYVTGPTPAISASAGTQMAALPSTSVAAPAPAAATEQATASKPATKLSCEQQTWPYLDNRCIARGKEAGRNVRFVLAPRAGEAAPAATASLVTSDTVLRGPGVAPEASDQPVAKKPAKRSETRRQRSRETDRDGSRVYSVYSVPSGDRTRPVIVVRPLRLGADSPRF